MGLTRNSIIISGVIMAFIVGSITTGTLTSAQKDGQGGNQIIDALNNIADAINGITPTQTVTVQSLEGPEGPVGPEGEQGDIGPQGPTVSEMPISLGGQDFGNSETPCSFSDGTDLQTFGGPVLLSDGTVKILSLTGDFITPDPQFGSLPAGVWHDMEGFFFIRILPDTCFSTTQLGFSSQELKACAVADNGDVYCVKGEVRDGIFSGDPWTFKGDAIP